MSEFRAKMFPPKDALCVVWCMCVRFYFFGIEGISLEFAPMCVWVCLCLARDVFVCMCEFVFEREREKEREYDKVGARLTHKLQRWIFFVLFLKDRERVCVCV